MESNLELDALARHIDLWWVLYEPESNHLWLAARTAQVLDVADDSMHFHILKFINGV